MTSASSTLFLIIFLAGLIALTWWSSRKSKKQVRDFRSSLRPGTLVVTVGGVIGTIVSVDKKYEEIVIDSEGTLMRFTTGAVNKEYVRPAFIDDDEVDERGNPINDEVKGKSSPVASKDDSKIDQKAFDSDVSLEEGSEGGMSEGSDASEKAHD